MSVKILGIFVCIASIVSLQGCVHRPDTQTTTVYQQPASDTVTTQTTKVYHEQPASDTVVTTTHPN